MMSTTTTLALTDVIAGPAGQKFALALLHFTWQGAVVAVAATAAVRLFRLAPGAPRHAAYLTAMVAMAALPAVTYCIVAPPGANPGYSPPAPAGAGGDVRAAAPVPFSPGTGGGNENAGALATPAASGLAAFVPWLNAAWLTGAALLSLRLAAGFVGVSRLRRTALPPPPEVAAAARRAALGLGLHRTPRVALSERLTAPLALGFIRPLVLLPPSLATGLAPDLLAAVIAHELAHLRRWDLWVNLFQRLVEIALFYHPAVWWISGRIRVERENSCDDLAVRATGDRLAYASMLERVGAGEPSAGLQPGPAATLAAGLGGRRQALLARVRRVLDLTPPPERSRWWLAGAGVLTLAVGAGSAAAVKPAESKALDPLVGVAVNPAAAAAPETAPADPVEETTPEAKYAEAVAAFARVLEYNDPGLALSDPTAPPESPLGNREAAAGRELTRVFALRYIGAAETASFLELIGLGAGGRPLEVLAMNRSNSLVITGTKPELDRVAGIIERLDRPVPFKTAGQRRSEPAGPAPGESLITPLVDSIARVEITETLPEDPIAGEVAGITILGQVPHIGRLFNPTDPPAPPGGTEVAPDPPPAGANPLLSETRAPGQPAAAKPEPPSPTAAVRLVVEAGGRLTFQGAETNWEALPAKLEAVGDPAKRRLTVLELAAGSGDLTLAELEAARGKAGTLARHCGFAYLSYIGIHPPGSTGTRP